MGTSETRMRYLLMGSVCPFSIINGLQRPQAWGNWGNMDKVKLGYALIV